jgi:DNA polymerase-3 subunit gamma/tau
MSYQVLARKYRPKSFETLVGQEHVVRALSHALDQQRLHHAYLFTGTRGVGKTTLSRILAKSFNCEKGITAHPCGVCDACTAIDAGRFVDYIEMDAASNRGVDEMASLLEQAIYAPSNARFKVYMIDEVHMLTNHAFNSMLKTLEEPPEHVKFILATTDPQKIPVTVLSRCLQFNLKQMPPGHIVGHLQNILGQEQIEFEVPALRLLAQGAHGSMRDALSLTDQAIAYAAGMVSLDAVQSMLGALDQSYLIRLLDALVLENGTELLAVADEMSARSLSYKAALQDLGSMLHQIAIAQIVPSALADELPERAELLRLAQSFNKEEVQLYYQIAVHGRNEIGLAPDEYAGFSMTLLRMLAFRPSSTSNPDASSGNNASSARLASTPAAPRPITTALSQAPLRSSAQAPSTIATPIETQSIQQSVTTTPTTPAAAANAPATATTAVTKPMSPAMAALAAARAGSAKKQASSPTSTQSSGVSPSPESPAKLEAVNAQVSASISAPVTATPTVDRQVTTTVQSKSDEVIPAYVDDNQMPPPWDDLDFESQALPPNTRRNKDIQEGDYWKESDTDAQSLDLVSVQVSGIEVENSAEAMTPAQPTSALDSQQHLQQTPRADHTVDTRNQSAEVAPILIEATENLSTQVNKPLQLIPMSEISWDGHWPNLAASLPLRGVAQQLAQQSELRQCLINGNAIQFKLCVPLQTLLSAGSGEKLIAALNDRFAEFGREIRIDFEIGAVEQTANAQAVAERAERQTQAEQAIQSDSFVQTLMREFGASILTGSVRPI